MDAKLQVVLKTEKDLSTSDINTLAAKAVGLEIAGVTDKQSVTWVNAIGRHEDEWVNTAAEKVKVLNISNKVNPKHTDKEKNANYFPKDYRTNAYRSSDNNNPRYKAKKVNDRGYRVR